MRSLNPYCSGRWSRTLENYVRFKEKRRVLILIVVEDGLVQDKTQIIHNSKQSLNPYCSGRWSRTILKNKRL